MKQPRVFSRGMVIDGAFELLRTRGRRAVTAREVAKQIGSSTMPIYSHMKSLDDLEVDLRQKTLDLLKEYQQRTYTPEALLNISIGYVVFARDEPELFKYLFIESRPRQEENKQISMRDAFFSSFTEESPEMKVLKQMSPEAQEQLMRNTHIYTHGLAMLAHMNMLGPWDTDRIVSCLNDAGQAFYMLEHTRE